MDKLILFPEATSKSDLVANKNYISVLDSMCLECKLNKRLDSNHISTITLESNLAKDIVNLLSKKQVIKVLSQGVYDYYNIVSIDTSLDNIEITCRHWTIESQNSMFIVDSKPKNLGSLAMLDWLKTASQEYKLNKQYARDLEVGGNITDLVSTNIWHDNFYNSTNKLIELYGAECKREGFKVELLDYVGSKNVKYKVEYAVNLLANTTSNDFDITLGVLAKGYDKLYADNIVYSGLLTAHPNALGVTKEIEYPIRVREEGKEDEEGYIYYDTEAEAKAELEKLAAEEFTVNKIDMPLIEHNTKFIDLSLTEEHEGELKTFIDIGDKVNTVIPQYNLDIETRVVEMVIDILSDEIEDITLSNNDIKDLIPPTINSIKQEIAKLPSINDVINIAKEESLNTVMQGFNGYAYYFPNFTAWMDSDDIKKAKNGLIANKNGWFFTRDGVNPSSDKVTMIADINGNFSANVINTGELRASLIKVGILSDVTNKTWINMEDGTFNFADKVKYDGIGLEVNGSFTNNNINGIKAVKINNSEITLYDWERNGRELGHIYSSYFINYPNCRGLSLAHSADSYMTLGYKKSDGNYGSYMIFDKNLVNPSYQAPIRFFESVLFNNAINVNERLYLPDKLIFESSYSATSPQIFKNTGDSRNMLCTQVSVNAVNDGYMLQSNTGGVLFSILAGRSYPILCNNHTQISGNLSVTGSKNSLQKTENYGDRLINAYETAEYYFGDIGSGVINDTGECCVYIDDILQECVNLNCEYHVFTQVYKGSISEIDRQKQYFIVKGTPGTKFSWEFKAKRKGYENVRLDIPDIEGYYDSSPSFEEDFKANTSEEILNEEIEFNLENILLGGN